MYLDGKELGGIASVVMGGTLLTRGAVTWLGRSSVSSSRASPWESSAVFHPANPLFVQSSLAVPALQVPGLQNEHQMEYNQEKGEDSKKDCQDPGRAGRTSEAASFSLPPPQLPPPPSRYRGRCEKHEERKPESISQTRSLE